MKKTIIFIVVIIFSLSSVGQEKRKLIVGKVLLKNHTTSDIHVLNKNTNRGTIINEKGIFELPIKKGDSIYFSHINLNDKLIVITKEIISENNLNVQLSEKTHVLEEIVLEKSKSIFYLDKEIMPHNLPIVNSESLNLPYANVTGKKDKSLVKIKSGFTVNLDGILNRLNGKYKQEKLAKEIALEDKRLLQIRKDYTDDFFITDLKIKKEYINQFLNFCIEKNIIYFFVNDNKIKLTHLLIKESEEFPHKIYDERLLLTKN
ncbi:hypothetical protein OD91_2705 [Lutibacter sp. Hel_I_33_5]|uniref:hypothetical protein n=1 Tax=Lutibacter sp. Hel_I_33_5 TaxID=1566289 RepID=UPI0011A3A79E|nr:hypothetical protein [Lutibacter sp. Hel_I_33_5]TVZ57384.1 hypothetical protein OD91_2705 [Lutibacter sp. Hel_I_33_5]